MICFIYMLKPVHVTLPLALLSPLELLQCEQILLLETQLLREQNIAKKCMCYFAQGSISIRGQSKLLYQLQHLQHFYIILLIEDLNKEKGKIS